MSIKMKALMPEKDFRQMIKDKEASIDQAVREGGKEIGIMDFEGKKWEYEIQKGQVKLRRHSPPPAPRQGKLRTMKFSTFDQLRDQGKIKIIESPTWNKPEGRIEYQGKRYHYEAGPTVFYWENPGKEEGGTSGKGSMAGIMILVVALILLFIIIYVWSARGKEEDGDIIPDGNGTEGPIVEWHDYVAKNGLEIWVGHPDNDHWCAIWHRVGYPGSWSFYIFPDPGGNPYTGAGQTWGYGPSPPTLQELYDYLIVHFYAEALSRAWLIYMRDHVFPDYGLVIS